MKIPELLQLPYDQLPIWWVMEYEFDSEDTYGLITKTNGHRDTNVKTVFTYNGKLVTLPLTFSIRQAKKMIYAYLIMHPPEDQMTDGALLADIVVFMDKGILDKLGRMP